MNLLVVADGHYYIDKAGNVFVESVFDYTFYDNGKLVAVLNTNYIKMILGVEELLLDETEHR